MTAWAEEAMEAFRRTGIDVAAYLPDTPLDPLLDRLEADDTIETVLVAREEEAVGVLAGAWLAGRKGVMLCQSSGLANSFNAIGSLSVPARIPFLCVTNRRGNLGEFNLAQVPAGYGMGAMLDAMGVRNRAVDRPEELGQHLEMAGQTAFSTETPFVVLLEATVAGYKADEVQG